MSWTAAKSFCEAKGAHLATVTSQAENDFLVSTMIEGKSTWLGGTDAASEGNWKWITGEPWSYTNWGSGEPNNHLGIENYLGYYPFLSGWNDFSDSASYPTSSYLVYPLCEWEFVNTGTGLNDTGITFCGDASTNTANCATVAADGGTYPRQDARYGRDAQAAAGTLTKVGGGGKGFDFTKIANNGSVLPASATLGSGTTDWACTRDNVTGLIWEVKTTSGLRSQSHTYTWYNSNTAINGGAVGTASGGTCATTGRCDTEKFVQDVNAAGLCGASDWRMPTVKELEGIVDFGRVNPAIDPDYFPNTPISNFWSGSPYANYSNYAWFVYFSNGYAYGYANDGSRGNYYAIRLVRIGQ